MDSNLFPTGLIGFHTSLKSLADPLDCRYSSSASPAPERVNEPFGSISSFSRFSMVRKVRDTATKEYFSHLARIGGKVLPLSNQALAYDVTLY